MSLEADAGEERLRRAWASLLTRAEPIADSINDGLERHAPQWFEQADPELVADVRQSTHEHVRRGLQTLAGQGDPERTTTDVWRETGRRRARQGVSLELTLNAYTMGSRILWEALLALDRSALGLDDQLLLSAGQRLWRDLHVQNAVLIEAHRHETARLTRRDQQRQQGILDRLAEGTAVGPDFVEEAAGALGIAPGDAVACVVAPTDDAPEEPLRGADDRLERAGLVSFWHARHGMLVGLIPLAHSSAQGLADVLRPTLSRVGIAVAPDGLLGFPTAYQLATRTAQTLPRGTAEVALVNERLPELMVSGSPEVASLLVDETVGPLLQHPQARTMLTTLTALIRCNGSPTRAAEQLFCHRNTVLYRLKQIERISGRSLDVPRDRLMLALGLVAVGHSETQVGRR